MNPEIQKCREHYQTLPPHVKDRATAKFLLTAIQIAEATREELDALHLACRIASEETARVSKSEGK